MDGSPKDEFEEWVERGCRDEQPSIIKGREYIIVGQNLFGVATDTENASGDVTLRMSSGKLRLVHKDKLAEATSLTSARKYVPKPPLKFLSYDDMVRLPDPEWLIDGVIMEQTSALLYGKSNSYKSFLAIDMACSVTTGDIRDGWHGHDITDGWPVLYVATEGALGVAKQRIPGWYDAHDVPYERRGDLALYPQEIALDDESAVNDLIKSCAIDCANREETDEWHNPAHSFKLVVIDIFGASMTGPETSDETARAWVRNVNHIMRSLKCAVLTVAHTGWADSTRARMHTHFWGSFDTRLIAEGNKESLTSVLKVERHKDADSSGVWGFRLDKVTLADGYTTTLVPRLCDEIETKQKRRVSGKPNTALQALSEASIESGRKIAGPNYPNRLVVTLAQWRTMCDRHGLSDSEASDSQRKAFNRAKSTLMEKGLIKQFDDKVWKVSDDD